MIAYIPSVPIVPRRPHHDYGGGGTDILISVFIAVYIAILVYLIIEIFKRLKDL